MNGKERRIKVKTNMYYVNNLKDLSMNSSCGVKSFNYYSIRSNWAMVIFGYNSFCLNHLTMKVIVRSIFRPWKKLHEYKYKLSIVKHGPV